jgi:hypothetical protein
MSLLDVSKVTSTLMRLLEAHIGESPAWPSAVTLDVSAEPPDRLGGDAALGLYLYHVTEDPHRRNAPPPGGNGGGVRFAPMALNLHYQLTPHSDLGNSAAALREQLIMGCALKALHDFPVVDDDTEIAGTPILDPSLANAGNRFRIVLQPLPFGEAPSFWTAEEPLRLAAYYEVSVVLLESDEPPSRAGRVLRRAVFVFPTESPRVDASRSMITFTAPGDTQARELEARPAQVPVGRTFELEGSMLAGDRTELVLRSVLWDDPVVPDAGTAGWNVVATPTRITATVRASAGAETVVPGLYGVSARVARPVRHGSPPRAFEQPSNETPLLVIPAVTSIAFAAGVATVAGGPFAHASIAVEEVEVYVGEARLARGASADPAQGEFVVDDAATLRLRPPASVAPGSTHALRVIVRGAESEPRWVTLP